MVIRMLFLMCLGWGSVCGQALDTLVMKSAISRLDNAKAYTLAVAALMPADKYGFKPAAEEMSFAGQLLHLSQNLGWLSSAYLGDGKNPVAKADMQISQKDSVQRVITRAYDYALETLRRFDPSRLADTVKFFAGPMNLIQILSLINDHQAHHRGQLVVYLRLNGITPPRYVGW